ncbi:receptor-type tyrosine-protein phosphatase delta-like [Lytechinus pictus]|uniref:receptor-type tyrosine-protein phosphatase delta-like n=1 Tax=Lytechinus pictus TaxID=7653 RepID=UPI0030B9C5FF
MVRDCPAGFWGRGCDQDCPNCLNGGICDDVTGVCVCPPGFTGQLCSNGLGKDTFGQLGQFRCSEDIGNITDCRGVLVCNGPPYGCSCAAGYKGADCMQECEDGYFGADCDQTCHCLNNALCAGDTGRCDLAGGCEDGWAGVNCQEPTPRITSFTASPSNGSNFGTTISFTCTATFNFTDTSLTLQVYTGTPEGKQIPSEVALRDVTKQTQTTVVETVITRAAQDFECRLSAGDNVKDQAIVNVKGHEQPSLSRPPTIGVVTSYSVELTWDAWNAAVDAGSGPVTAYILQYREHGHPGWEVAGNVTEEPFTYTVTSLSSRLTYDFQVVAVRPGLNGEGEPTPIISTTTPCASPDPIPTLSVSPTPNNPTSLLVSWELDPNRRCDPSYYIVHYDVTSFDQCSERRATSGIEASQSGTFNTTERRLMLNGLNEYSTYIVSVAPGSEDSVGENITRIASTLEDRPTSAPAAVEVIDLSTNSVTLNWGQVPCGHRKGLVSNYLLMLRGAQQGTQIVSASQHFYTFPDLSECVMYNFTVAAHNIAGVGPESPPLPIIIPATVAPGSVRNLRFTATPTEIHLSWEPPLQSACQLEYIIRYTPQVLDQCIVQLVEEPIVAGNTNTTTDFTIAGLVPYSTYSVEVLARNSIGFGVPEKRTIQTAESVPENVTDLAVVETTENSISLAWDLPCGHTHGGVLLFHYELSNENVPVAALTEGDSPNNVTSLTINNLASCTPYEFRIRAKTSAGYGHYAKLYHVRTQGGEPGMIETMFVHTYASRPFEADVTWSPPEVNGCPIIHYRVTYVLTNLGLCEAISSNMQVLQFAGNTSLWFIRLSNLEPYSRYEVNVQAVSDAGMAPVAVRSFQTQPAAPGQVQFIDVTERTQSSLKFRWNTLECGDRHGPEVIYHYRLESPSGLYWSGQVHDPVSLASVYGLLPCLTYSFWVQAETSAGFGDPSNALFADTTASPPGPVTSLTLQSISSGEINITWSAPAAQPCPIFSYGLRYIPTNTDQCSANLRRLAATRALDVETQSTSAIVSGLLPFTTYRVMVWARTGAPNAGQEVMSTVVTQQAPPTASPTVNEPSSFPHKPTKLNVSWEEVPCGHRSGDITFYAYELESLDDSTLNSKTSKIPATLRYVTLDDLEPCEVYQFRVRARTRKGWGPFSSWKKLTTNAIVSDEVSIVLAETSSDNPTSIRLSWNAPPNQKCPINNYVVAYRLVRQDRCLLDDDWSMHELAVRADHRDVEINSLIPFSTYELKVFAVTEAGNGSMSVVVVQTGETIPTEAPDAIYVDLVTSREIEFSWREPPCGTRHGDIVHYEYQLLDTNTNHTLTATTTETVVQIGFLTPYTEYQFTVRASSLKGYGPFSEQISASTLVAPPPKPTGLVVLGIGDTSVTLQWMRPDPPHGIIKEYRLQYWRQKEQQSNYSIEVTIRSEDEIVNGTLIGLSPYTAYVIKIRGVTSAGPGDWSDEINVGTSEGLPGPVTELQVLNRTLDSIELRWEAPKQINGELLGYTISYEPVAKSDPKDGNISSHRPVMDIDSSNLAHILISELDPATEYIFRISANNRVGDGTALVITEFTKVPAPISPKAPSVSSAVTEDNMVTIQLQPLTESLVNAYRVTVKRMNEVAKRSADYGDWAMRPVYPGHYTDSPYHWIAAEFGQGELPNVFTVGDNRTYGGFHNAPLAPGSSYGISMCSVSRTTRDMASSCSQPIEVKANPNPTSLSNATVFPNELKAALGVILLVVMVAVLIVAVIRRRKRLHTTRPKEGIGLSALESGGENGGSMSNGASTTLPALSRSTGVYKAKPRGLSVNAIQNGQNGHGIKRGNGAMRQRPKTAPKPSNPSSIRARWQAPPAVKLVELSSYVKEKTANGEMCFKLDYERLPDGQMYTWEVATRQENVSKNRYINIIPYDHSRVILDTDLDAPHEDYINASFVSGYLRPKAYIATQGPLSTSVFDFWRMVWQERVPIIVMLTKLVENKKRKCDPYWPEDIETYGDFTIAVVAERNYHNYTERTLTIRKAWDPEERRVQHFHYTSWPDMGLPLSATPLLEFITQVKEFEAKPSGPTIVHCSAGVGRTGTYITIDSMMDMAAREQQVNVLDFIYRMRTKRVKMVQTPEQYVFIYEALLECLLCGYTSVPTKSIVPYFTRLEQTNLHTKRTFLEEHLHALDAMSIFYSDVSMQAGKSAENHHKNRYPDIVPLDKYRPYLMTGCGEGQTNYVNATFLDGFSRRDMYMATQMPLPHTIEDFWRMIYDYNSNVIVMLNDINKNDQTCAQYWPAGDESLIGPFVIDVSAEEREGDVIIRTFLLSNTNTVATESSRVIRQYSFVGWKERQKYPKSLSSLLCLLELVEAGQRDVGNGPITVHCMDGATRSGLFCAIMSTISKLKTEGNIDVFHAVKKLRKCSGRMVPTEEQYLYIHDVVREYLASCEIYENFR